MAPQPVRLTDRVARSASSAVRMAKETSGRPAEKAEVMREDATSAADCTRYGGMTRFSGREERGGMLAVQPEQPQSQVHSKQASPAPGPALCTAGTAEQPPPFEPTCTA